MKVPASRRGFPPSTSGVFTIGAGEIDYDVVADHLEGFDGTVAVEVFTDDVELLRDSARRARNHLGTDS